ncbi:MAG TPA: MFS transporter [Trebonia sp.]|nr:MFS transporter [Trebonia sp.]
MSVVLDAVRPYRRLFAEPALRGLAVADACARLPQGMVSIALLMVTAVHASMTIAGLAVAGYALGQGITGPPRGRLADRYGLVRVAAVCGGGYSLALIGLLAAALTGAPAGVLIATAGAAGLMVPPLSPGMRSLWSVHAAGGLRQAAFAFDAVVFDLASIVGPALASALAVGVDPAAALLLLLALTGAAIVILRTRERPRETARAPARQSIAGLLRSGAFRRLLITGAFVNIALSGTEVALTAYVRHHHALWAAGPLLAEISVGSIVGSLVLGARTTPGGKSNRFFRLLACYALGLAALTAAGLDAPLLAVAAPLAGLCLGSVLATLFSRAGSAAPPGSDTEAQGWLNSVMNGGASAGAAIAGLASGNPVLALGLAAAAAAIAAAAAFSRTAAAGPPVRNGSAR